MKKSQDGFLIPLVSICIAALISTGLYFSSQKSDVKETRVTSTSSSMTNIGTTTTTTTSEVDVPSNQPETTKLTVSTKTETEKSPVTANFQSITNGQKTPIKTDISSLKTTGKSTSGVSVPPTLIPSVTTTIVAPKIDIFTQAKSVLNTMYTVGTIIRARTGSYEGICYDSTLKNTTLPLLNCLELKNSWAISVASSSGEVYCADHTSYVGPGKLKSDGSLNITCGETPKGVTPKPDIIIKSPICVVGALNSNTTLACSITVINDSDVAIPGPFIISGLNTKMSVQSLGAHEERTIRFTADNLPNSSDQSFLFTADSGNVIEESNENNNKELYVITQVLTSAYITGPVLKGGTHFGTTNQQISFYAYYVANGSPVVNVWWNYGDGYSSGTLKAPLPYSGDNTNYHAYGRAGTYKVTFTIKTEDNREIVSDYIIVVIN